MVVPEVGCCLAFEVLGFALSLEDGDELGRQGHCLAAPFLDLPRYQPAAPAVGTHRSVPEVKEETGLQVEADREIGRRVHPATGRTMIYMAAKPSHGTDILVGDRDELAEVRWATLPEADTLTHGWQGLR
jgi:hypothetical protein